MCSSFFCHIALALAVFSACAVRADSVAPGAARFFESEVRPLLLDRCIKCHGPEKHKGGLRLDSRAAVMTGGENGAVVIEGDTEHSRLIRAIGYEDKDLQMPPKEKLNERQIAVLTRWVKMGLPWPGSANAAVASAGAKGMEITAEQKAWWAFQPIRPLPPPAVRHSAWLGNPIDAFIAARLEAKGLAPAPPADRRELIRRAYFDLIGLPPTPEEVARFIADSSPEAYEKVIDDLLARPQYGEHAARAWLDVVRYAQTNGYERDDEKPFAWRYRDYVIRALNKDTAYDQFIREQLAGDELDHVTDDSIIATGFYRIGVWDDEPDDKLQADADYVDDNLRTIGTAFLGLTIGCARCHDHKFDPIPQTDYYSLAAFLGNIAPHELPKYTADSATLTPLGGVAKFQAEQKAKAEKISPLKKELDGLVAAAKTKETPENQKNRQRLERQIKEIESQTSIEWALSIRERGREIPAAHVFIRGNAHSPGAVVHPAFLSVLGGQTPPPLKTSNPNSTGLRRALADWIVSAANPLTARVIVNRIWQGHFGRGIVRTPDDFGKTGLPPTHPELLDWLAKRFMDEGWSIKRLHKLIMLSSAYRMSSRADNAAALQVDPDNDLFWRQNLRRLSAEALRDSILSVSGELNAEMGGRGFFPRLSKDAISGASRPGAGWHISAPSEELRRSIYIFIKRSMLPPMLETFDFSNVSLPQGVRPETTIAPQALMLLNDQFMQDRARAMAARLVKEAGERRPRQIERAFELALGRKPSADEAAIAASYLDRQSASFAKLARRMTFAPEVPSAVHDGYLKQLTANDFMSCPRGGWQYAHGKWGGGYEGIMNVEMSQTPFALAANPRFVDGTVEARFSLHKASVLAGFIIRGVMTQDTHRGYDIMIEPRTGEITLERHDGSAVNVLGRTPMKLSAGEWHTIKIEVTGAQLRVWLDRQAAPLIDITDPHPLKDAGTAGIRTWGAALDVEDMKVTTAGVTTQLNSGDKDLDQFQQQALASFCLMMMNLNEFVYID